MGVCTVTIGELTTVHHITVGFYLTSIGLELNLFIFAQDDIPNKIINVLRRVGPALAIDPPA